MAYPTYIREKTRQLRRDKKLTIDELAERMAIPRTTIYYWVRDLPIPRSGSGGGWPESARRKGTRAMQARYRQLREVAYDEGIETFYLLSATPTFRDFVCMYIGEGYKRCRNTVSIANSDPAVICLAWGWMNRLAGNPPYCCIQFHADQDAYALCGFWGSLLSIAPDSIHLQRKSNSNQLSGRTWRSKFGVLTIVSNDTLFRAELQAWIDCLEDEWALDSG